MKKIFVLIVILLLAGCAPSELQETIYIEEIDFTQYSEQNFLITPEHYLGDYESIGWYSVTYYPGITKKKTKNYNDLEEMLDYQVGEFKSKKALDSLYNYCKSKGANAIMNFGYEWLKHNHDGVNIPGVKMYGFAIKRNGAFK